MLSNLFLVLISAKAAFSATLYVSPSGSDTAAGTLAAPYKSIQVAVNKAVAGDTIYLRAGTYSPTTNIQIKSKSGTASAPITLSSYSGEKVVIDGEGLPYTQLLLMQVFQQQVVVFCTSRKRTTGNSMDWSKEPRLEVSTIINM